MIEIHVGASEAEELQSLEIRHAVWPRDALTIEEVHSFKASMRDCVDALALEDGVAIGSAFAGIRPQRPDRVFALVTVLSEHRGCGAGSGLYETISAWAADHGLEQIDTSVEEEDLESFAFAERRGFVEIERDRRMVLDLARVGEEVALGPPPGIQIVSWAERPGLDREMYEVARETYPDIPGSEDEEMEPFEDWLEHDMRRSGDVPEATFVALAGNEVIGYAKLSLTAAQPKVARHHITGLKRAWRGQGVAAALKRAQIAWAKRQRYEQLRATNELRNEPIRRLNARLGYREEPGRVFLLGPLGTIGAA